MKFLNKLLSLALIAALCTLMAGGAALAQTVTETFYDYSPESSDPAAFHTVFAETWMYNVDASGQRTSGRPVGTDTYEEAHEFGEDDVCGLCGYEDTTLRIITQPEDIVIAVNTVGYVKVVAKGKDLSYQWQYRSGSGWINPSGTTVTTDTLGINGIYSNSGHMFRCVITDGDGNSIISNVITATVVHAIGHTLAMVEFVSPTCEQPGNRSHWRCNDCGRLFQDANGQNEISARSVIIPARGHSLVKTDAADASCEAAGNIEYWRCSTCGKLFSDESARTEITAADTVLPALGHSPAKVDAADASCEAAGNIEYWRCSACGKLFSDESAGTELTEADTVLPALGHSLAKVDAVDASCEAAGSIEYWRCSACGKLFGDESAVTEISAADTVLPALGHTLAKIDAVEATYEAAGNIEYWRCSACGKLFGDGTGEAELTEDDVLLPRLPMEILSQPISATVVAGETASFKVQVGGYGVSYRWQYRNSGDASSWDYTGLNGNATDHLSFEALSAFNGRQFRCVISDAFGEKLYSNAVTLTVLTPAKITKNPSDVTVAENGTAVFAVTASGDVAAYQWEYRDAGGEWGETGLNGAKTPRLSFTAPVAFNGRQYRCRVSDVLGNTVYSNAATLTVGTAAKITRQPVNATVAVNGTAVFAVTTSGTVANYRWQYWTGSSGTWADTNLNGASTARLSFTAPAGFNGRQFRCVVTDTLGNTVYSNAATLSVGIAAKITANPSNAAVAENGTAVFAVTASGDVKQYQWQYRTGSSGAWTETNLNGASTARLSFTAPAAFNGRQFRCAVTDVLGNIVYSGAATLTVGTAAKITRQPANASAAANGTAVFSVATSGTVVKYQWQYRTNSSSAWANTGLNGASTARLSFTAPAGFNGRQFRCVITDAFGHMLYSDAATLTVR